MAETPETGLTNQEFFNSPERSQASNPPPKFNKEAIREGPNEIPVHPLEAVINPKIPTPETNQVFEAALQNGHLGSLEVVGSRVVNGFIELELQEPGNPASKSWVSSSPELAKARGGENVMGGTGAAAPATLEDVVRVIGELPAKLADELTQSQQRLGTAQRGDRQEAINSIKQRVGGGISDASAGLLLAQQESVERQAISIMYELGNWLREDEEEARIAIVQQNPNPTPAQLAQQAEEMKRLSHAGFTRVRERAEAVLRLVEQNEELEFRSGMVQELYTASDVVFKAYPELAYEVKNNIETRMLYRAAFLAAKYKGGKDFGGALAGFLPEFHNASYIPGVEAMCKLMEEATDNDDIKHTMGQYFRGLIYMDKYDDKGNEIAGSRRLVKDGQSIPGTDEKVDSSLLQAMLKVRLVRMKANKDPKDARPDIIKANHGGFGLGGGTFSDEIMLYAFTQIQKSLEGGGGKLPIDVKDLAERLAANTEDASPLKFMGQDLMLNRADIDTFVKCIQFANRAYDIGQEREVITGFTMDATGPVLKRRGDINGIKYDRLALPEHVYLEIPKELDLARFMGAAETNLKDIDDLIIKLAEKRSKAPAGDQNELDRLDKQRDLLVNQKSELIGLISRYRLDDPSLSDNEKSTFGSRMAEEFFGDARGQRIDISDLNKLDEFHRGIVDKVRSKAGFFIAGSWNLAFREYFHEHMDEIDVDASNVSKIREVGRVQWLPVYLSQIGNRHPGEAEELRKEVFLGVVSPRRTTARETSQDVIDSWGSDYNIVARHANDRYTGGAAIKGKFYEGDEHLLYNFELITDPAKFIKTFTETTRSYMSVAEHKTVDKMWAKALTYFGEHNLIKYWGRNLGIDETLKHIYEMFGQGILDNKTAGEVQKFNHGPLLLAETKYLAKKGNWLGAIWIFMSGLFTQGFKALPAAS